MNEEIEKLRACVQRLRARLALYEERSKRDAAIKYGEELSQKYETLKRSRSQLLYPWRKAGTPGKWEGRLGLELLEAVEDIWKEKGADIGIAAAIKILCKSSPTWAKYNKGRALEARYQEAKKFWQPWIEQYRDLDAELEKFRLISDQLDK